MTNDGIGVIMDQIVSVEWDSLLNAHRRKDDIMNLIKIKNSKGVVWARDINNNIIVLGEYKEDITLLDLVASIMKWAADPEDTRVFVMPLYEDVEAPPFYEEVE